jgi:lysophospholipase L1-like esterase
MMWRDKSSTSLERIVSAMFLIPALCLGLLIIPVGEVIARAKRITDFPTYVANDRIGYIPAPNQSGSYRNRGAWAFNERSMGTKRPFAPSIEDDVLLIGDSIVFGRISATEDRRLGGRVAALSGKSIWPISAGSWSLQNEMQYLRDNQDILRSVDRLVIILNSNDFGKPSSWRSEAHRPTQRPASALLAWIKGKDKQKLPPPPAAMVVPPEDPLQSFRDVLDGTNIPVDVWLYPKLAELENPEPLLQHQTALEAALRDRVRTFRVADIPGWSKKQYADRIHPNAAGDALLARAIAQAMMPT